MNNKLKWDNQINNMIIKAKKGLNVMRAFAGTWWGADPKTLKMAFNGLVRSHLDYGSIFLKPTSQKNLNKMNTVFYQGLRLITGCMKSTPINSLIAEVAEMDLEFRRRWLSNKFIIKNLTINNNVLIKNLVNQKQTLIKIKNNYGIEKEPGYLINSMTQMEPYRQRIKTNEMLPCFEMEYDIQTRSIQIINLGIGKDELGSAKKFLEVTDQFRNNHTFIYTDASKQDDASGFGIHIPQIDFNFSARLPNYLNICNAEMAAINEAIRVCIEKKITKGIIFTDSKSAIEKLSRTTIDTNNDYISLLTKRFLLEAHDSGVKISLAWIPGHAMIPGNEKVDKLANIGRNLRVPREIQLTREDFTLLMKKINSEDFRNGWQASRQEKGKWYERIQDKFPVKAWFEAVPFIDRRHLTTIIRMRTGHCHTAEHLSRMGIGTGPSCECGQLEDLNHMLFECPINKIENLDLYKELRDSGMETPLSIVTVLRNINNRRVKLIMKFLNQNKINL